MIDDGVIGVGIAGAISAAYFIFYAVGQLVNGFLGDKISPFWMVSIGLCIVVLSNVAMMLLQPSYLYVLWWGINGYGHSMLWAPIYFVLSNMINQRLRAFALTAISISSPLGKISSALISGIALKGDIWQRVFFAVTIVCSAILLLWITGYLALSKRLIVAEAQSESESLEAPVRSEKTGFLRILLVSGVAIMLPSMFVHGLFYNGVVEMMPTILSEQYSMSASMAAILEIVIPLLSIAGVFVANFVYYKIFKKRDMRSAAFLMGMTLLPTSIMLLLAIFIPRGYLIGQYPVIYAFAYLFQFAFNHIVIVLLPVHFARYSYSSSVSGIENAINYGGSAISTYGMTYALLKLPLWQTVIIWMALLVVATVFVLLARLRWEKFNR